jgi:hypothetical protein
VNIGSVQPSEIALQGLTNVDDKRLKLQVALLRKTLDSQQEQSAELMRLMEGKGQVVDIRV